MGDEIPEDVLFDWVVEDDTPAISCSIFYELYKLWCQPNGETPWGNKTVGSMLKAKKLYKCQGQNKRDRIKRKYYVF